MDEPSTSALVVSDEENTSKIYSSRFRRLHKRKRSDSVSLLNDSNSCETFSYHQQPNKKSQNSNTNRYYFLWTIGFLSCILLMLLCYSSLTAFLWRNPHRTTTHGRTKTSLRTVYSGIHAHEGELWIINRHQVRRKRSVRNHSGSNSLGKVYGIARECGRHCSLKLKAGENEQEIRVRFSRFKIHTKSHNKKIHELETKNVVPLVQYMDSDQTHARLSRVSPDCIYTAHVNGSHETSIVNLCDRHGGLFGTLALDDEAYVIEPLDIHQSHSASQEEASETVLKEERVRRSIDLMPHLIYKSKTRSFETPISSFQKPIQSTKPIKEKLSEEDLFPNDYLNNTAWEDVQIRKARSRRSANSWDHFVEVLVVADYKMLLYHQGDLESYILTLFSTAGPPISNRAQDTLQQFCAWQQNYNDRNDDAINHHDVAILLTRHDICRATNKCDTLGLAELGTMCDPLRSCAIIEDNGLSAAFTIAHELGHIFNIPHDDERKCGTYMALNKHNYHIMAPTLEYNTHPWSWSACSAAMLSKFLDANRAQTQCILDQPIERRYYDKMFENPAPGAKYSVNQQCQFVFGPSAEICPYMPTCRRLWCSTYYGYQMGCRTQHMPWADGTPCGENMWCHRGQCVGMSPAQREKQDGAWGEWKAWGDCSRTCGGGVQKALRDCDNPRPMNGGKYCVGQRERYRPCNIHECPWDTPGFREVQCSEFDNRDVGIHGVSPHTKWVPKYTGISENERCKLYCRAKDSAAFYLLREKVLDGTPCDRNGDDICIDGTCHKAGCDHRLGSDMKRDVCGICGGDGSTCHTVEGVYNERVSFGYNEVFKIPAGSANIDITQKAHNRDKDDDNYLALRSANGEFILNGQYQVSVFRQQISIQDTVLEYSGSDQEVERINGTGPIRSDIYLHVLCVGNLHPPNIRYKYMVPRSTDHRHVQQHHMTSYYWRVSDYWSECSSKCQGSQTQQLICVDALSNRQVNERHCNIAGSLNGRRPTIQQRMCNVDCFAKWLTKEISGCSARCGRGEKQQHSNCVLAYTNGREDPVSNQECIQAGLPLPPDRTPCYSDCSGRKWAYSDWTPCSATCGSTGISKRTAYCIDDSNRQIDTRHCEMIPREASENECNRLPCPKWVYGHWSECSRSCDGGIRIRHVSCQNAAGQELEQAHCSQTERHDREKCNEHVCTQWKFGNWSTCSVTCGNGLVTRSAQCADRDGRVLADDRCDYRERIIQKQCYQQDCPSWKLGSWSACSVSCMDGWSSRLVMCVDANGQKIPDEKCSRKEEKPKSHQPCNHGPCPFWRPTDWSTCSVPCGSGIRKREVECVYRDQIVDASLCPESQKPETQEKCTLLACSVWDVMPWSSCSVSCGTGVQRRVVQCIRGANKLIVGDRECKEEKPKTERSCERDPCPNQKLEIYWATGPWSECSQSCGEGTQRRIVVCHDHLRELGAEYCTQIEKPPNIRECNMRTCAHWTVGPWQPCPATCGIHHVQRRKVICEPVGKRKRDIDINSILDDLPDTNCDPDSQPEAVKNCGLQPCPVEPKPVYGEWINSDWTECSASCGNGWRRRKVQCSMELCIESDRPLTMEQCNKGECKKASWQITPWSSCSVTCGNGGHQERTVWCQTDINGGQKVDDSECLKDEKKPITRRGCALPSCIKTSNILINPIAKTNSIDADSYTWESGKWSQCSATCGRGIRKRTVECIDAYGQTASQEKCDLSQKPLEQQKCRLGQCPRWHKEKWSTCSTTCGNGVKKRTVFCKKGKYQKVPDTECHKIAKPQETAVCQVGKCPIYYWKVTPWSKCTDPCKPSDQYRRVYCMSALHQRAASRMCANETEPITSRKCPTDKCPYEWVPGPWSTCSQTCGKGFHFRRIDCKVKRSMRDPNMSLKYDIGSEPTVLSRMCMSLPKPIINKECDMNPCDAKYRWSVLPWSSCSRSCGPGFRRRKTPCLDESGNRVARHHCDANSRPAHRETCFLRNCLPNDCAEIKAQNTLTHSIDGNYTVLVTGFRISVYCHLMNDTIPKTYINVRPDTNFAEFYGKRLKYPYTCPYEGRRNESCGCTNDDGHVNMGFSRFRKLRVDLHNMKINPHDFTFVDTLHGTPVPYGTAGDCYSMSECPQGTFSIDMRHTGLRIVDDLQWVDHGHRTNSRIERAENNAYIRGYCGGYCGECAPDRFKGLVIEVDQKQKPSVGVG